MKRVGVVLVASLVVLGLLPGTALAGVDTCSAISKDPADLIEDRVFFTILGSFAWMDGSCAGTGVVGGGIASACPAANLMGQWCSGMPYVAGQPVACHWRVTSSPSTVYDLAVGFDAAPFNGHIWFGGENVTRMGRSSSDPADPAVTYSFKFNATNTGLLIAYPISSKTGGSSTDETQVVCTPA